MSWNANLIKYTVPVIVHGTLLVTHAYGMHAWQSVGCTQAHSTVVAGMCHAELWNDTVSVWEEEDI